MLAALPTGGTTVRSRAPCRRDRRSFDARPTARPSRRAPLAFRERTAQTADATPSARTARRSPSLPSHWKPRACRPPPHQQGRLTSPSRPKRWSFRPLRCHLRCWLRPGPSHQRPGGRPTSPSQSESASPTWALPPPSGGLRSLGRPNAPPTYGSARQRSRPKGFRPGVVRIHIRYLGLL